MMTTMAALMATLPIALGLGAGGEAPPFARPHRRRRIGRVTMPDALHHAGGLSLHGIISSMVHPQTRQTPGHPNRCQPGGSVILKTSRMKNLCFICVSSVAKMSAQWNTKPSSGWKPTSSSKRNRRCGAVAPMNSARRRTRNVCPVCLGLPGVLPVPNEEALRLTVLTGFLLNCEIPRFAKFDRKSYFYPDMPKNYQITQYDKPSTVNGFVEFEFNGGSVARAFASRGRIWKRTWARIPISTATAAWISTAPACRSWKLFPSRTSPARTWPTNISTRSRTF
jgi:hypothetical protein